MKSLIPAFAVLLALAAIPAHACTPLAQDHWEQTPARVQQRYDSVDSVELVTLTKARKIRVRRGVLNDEMDAEEATFRVDRVFKGASRPGDKLVIVSSSGCAISVVNKPVWLFDVRTRKPAKLPRQWLLYRQSGEPTEITESPYTMPIDRASYDMLILEKLAPAKG